MQTIRSQRLPFERITREPEHNFFGYYDLQPWSGDGRYHLCNRVGFMDRMQVKTDRAELGMIRMTDHQFIPLASTYAWNFQQGTMLQWNPANPNEEIIYNVCLRDTYKCAIKNITTGVTRLLPRPLANVSQDGRYGLSVNFSRMFDFRPGYGYAGGADPYAHTPAPEDDGIHLVDLASGKDKLILSLSAISELFIKKFGSKNPKLLINHITFNPAGDRFLFLARSMPMPGKKDEGWVTFAATADLAGKNIHVMENHFAASHYIWRDNEHLLIYADMGGPWKMGLSLVKDQAGEHEVIQPDFFAFDGHCSYSPDKNFILYDSYPDADGYRKLLLYDIPKKKGLLLADLFSCKNEFLANEDLRCDLHPRWNRDGSTISFDSVHEGHRHVYLMDLP
jgi:hypothetical protein